MMLRWTGIISAERRKCTCCHFVEAIKAQLTEEE
jgi:hypothetical protein